MIDRDRDSLTAAPAGPAAPVESLRRALSRASLEAVGVESPPGVKLDRPPRKEFGDFATNVAMLVSSAAGRGAPRDVAPEVGRALQAQLGSALARFEVAGPGFLNLYLADDWFRSALAAMRDAGEEFGRGRLESPDRVNVEFVSANPTGPLHVGHARHAAYGDSLARVLAFAGHDVTREFYINDHGSQIERFGQSIAARIRQSRGEPAELPEDGYSGEYVKDIAAALGDIDPDDADQVAKRGVELVLEEIRETLGRFRAHFDIWSSERDLHGEGDVERTIERLRADGRTYEHDGAVWLRTTEFGDAQDRVLRRSSGETTYFASDIAFHDRKRLRSYDRLIDLFGADHHGYIGRMKAAFAALGDDPDRLEILIMQLVRLLEHGQEAKMSKRAGKIVTLDDLVAEIGVDAARFFLLQRSHDTGLDLDLALAAEKSRDNPVYYVQYAHARICSIMRNAADHAPSGSGEPAQPGPDVAALHPSERALILRLADLPEIVRASAAARAPHQMTAYALDLARDFTAFYRDCRVLDAQPPQAEGFRLALSGVTAYSLRRCLNLLGVEAPERM